jgi:acetylornithine/LysW-gamma-L-lysine aminotransferase
VRGFLCNSGTEAIEGAIKFARLATGRPNFVAAMRGFHGRTMGALSATHSAKYKEGFEPLISGFSHVPFNKLDRLDAAIDDQTAGVILEVVQGEGGVHVAEEGYLEGARRLCSERDAMLIIDEVQTGFCRTGRMFACEHFGLSPDILCVAKALAGGVPAAAILVNAEVNLTTGQHGTTFGGNPLAAAAGLAAIEFMIREELADKSRDKGAYLLNALREGLPRLGMVREVRGLGLMIGIECKTRVKEAIDRLAQEGVLVLTGGPSVIRLLPPLVITKQEIDVVLEKLFLVLG